MDLNRVVMNFKETAETDAFTLTGEFDWDLSVNLFIHVHCVEVNVEDTAAKVIVLDLLNECQLVTLTAFDLQVHKNVVRSAVAHHLAKCFGINLDVGGLNLTTVNDGRNDSFFTEAANGCGATALAGLGVEIKDSGHGRGRSSGLSSGGKKGGENTRLPPDVKERCN